jgi:hypothetical protein
MPTRETLVSSADAFRPRSTSEILDASIQIFRAHSSRFLALSVVALAPQFVVSNYSSLVVGPQYGGGAFLVVLPFLIATWIWFAVGDGAMIAAASDAYLGSRVDPRTALKRALPRTGAIVLSAILKNLIIGLGFAAVLVVGGIVVGIGAVAGGGGFNGLNSGPASLIAGGIAALLTFVAGAWWMLYASARFFAYRAAIMIEHVGATASLERSSVLSKGDKGRIIVTFLLLFFMYAAVYGLFLLIGYLASGGSVIGQIAAGLSALFIYPIIPIAITILYYDVRIRKEAYDVELMGAELGSTGATQSA